MKIIVKTNFPFNVQNIGFSSHGELVINLSSDNENPKNSYVYEAEFGESSAATRPVVTLLEQVANYVAKSNIKEKTKSSYILMMKHLQNYGDCNMEDITTEYIQNFITYLEKQGLQRGTVRLYFQKLACVLNDAYKNELFDERILRRVKRPKREQSKKSFLTERELKRLFSTAMPEKYDNMKNMFLFSCSTGLRFSDVANLQWKNVKTHNKHLFLEYHQQKTNTNEVLPLCAQAENLLRSLKRSGSKVFANEFSQNINKFLKRWCKAAKIRKRVSFHTARHSFCVMLLTYDVSIYTVQQLMCHSDIDTTKIYADITNKTKNKAVKKLPLFDNFDAKRA